LAEAPERLSDVLTRAITAVGAAPITAAVDKADITAVSGCTADSSSECFEQIAATIDVDQVVFGRVEAGEGGGLDVTLTLMEPDQPPATRSFHLKSDTLDGAAAELQPKVEAFLLGKEEPIDKPVITTPPPRKETQPRFSLGRVENYTWGIAGGGLALVVTGSILLIMADGKQSDVDNAPTDTVDDLEELADLERSGKRLTNWGNGLLIVGSLAAVTGIALAVRQGLTRPKEQPRLTIAPLPARGTIAGGFAVMFRGEF
jgi:hypothetical protein